MNLIKRQPRSLFSLDPFADMDTWSDQILNLMRTGENHFRMPATDIQETETSYEVSAEMPGVKKDDIKVTLDQGVLTIEAESHQEETREENGRLLRSERRYGRYMRRFALGPGIDDGHVVARLEDGVLHLTVPRKSTSPSERKSIEIQ
ncbi:MAG TPA: Hsp20/alpha crystallin family protein [Moraxellaceae bacterium]|nr:Hsp20/alpha crystallin family protein [Moraxellaceae bacterium]